jgi:hypothetical protein
MTENKHVEKIMIWEDEKIEPFPEQKGRKLEYRNWHNVPRQQLNSGC